VEIRILGPLEVVSGDEHLALGGPNQRALLALLVLHANQPVRRDLLIDEIWGESPPKSADVSLNGYVSKLRKLLANGSGVTVETRLAGYALSMERDRLDANRFEDLVAAAREDAAAGRPLVAQETLTRALALWRGSPLADLSDAPFAQPEIARLEETRLAAIEARYEIELELGRHDGLVPELDRLANDHRLREQPTALLMLALYRSGRQAEALQAYERTRRALAEELGLEPSESLRELQRRILQRDSTLAEPARPRREARPRRRGLRPVYAFVAFAAVAGAALLAVALGAGRGNHTVTVAANSLGALDPTTREFVSDIPVGRAPTLVAYGNGSAWVVNERGRIVSRIDSRSPRVVDNVSAPVSVTGLAAEARSIWVTSTTDSAVRRIDPAYNRIDTQPTRLCNGCGADLSAGDDALWTTDDFTTLERIGPRSATPGRADLTQGAHALAVGGGSVWVAGDGVTRVDPKTLLPEGTPIPTGRAEAIAFGLGAVWVAVGNRVVEIDPDDNSIAASFQVGSNPRSIAVGGHAVWVANSSDGTISRIDPADGGAVTTIHVGPSPVGLAFGGGRLWVSVQ